MLHVGNLRATGLCLRVSSSTIPKSTGHCLINSRSSSLSAIHRGVRRSERTQFGDWSSRGRRNVEEDRYSRRTSRAFDGAASPRQQHKLHKKLSRKATDKEEEESGRQTRRKRFIDPESSFGKKSFVYQIKHGSFKSEAAAMMPRPVEPPPFRTSNLEPKTWRSTKSSQSRPPQERPPQERPPTWSPPTRSPQTRSPQTRSPTTWSLKERSPQERSPQTWSPQTRSPQERSPQKWSPQTRSPQKWSPQERSPQKWSPRERSPQTWSPQTRSPQERSPQERSPQERSPQTWSPQTWSPQTRSPQERSPRERSPQERSPQTWSPQESSPQKWSPWERSPQTDVDDIKSRLFDRNEETPRETETVPYSRKPPLMAMNIKYTTAASQFLYGKSVVKAALEHGQRKLYHLYIYGGENRKDSKDNYILKRIAEKQGIPVTIVPTGEQRLMDKMSMGRPHNGFVLEASPLPQLPVTSLGNLVETPGKLGFHVDLDYQSKEEEEINGQDTFVARKTDVTPKPFVLLLNEILDPGNLGGLLRTASYLGIDAVGITNRTSAKLTPVVLKAAAGAVEEVTMFTVDSPVSFIENSRKAGWKTYAAVAPPELKLARKHGDKFISTDFIEQQNPLNNDPCILIMGNEGYGLSKPIKVAADYELSIPRFVRDSSVDSLNVSVAAGLLCHAFVKAPQVARNVAAEINRDIVQEKEVVSHEEEAKHVEELF